jgi:hypothetical protein
MCLVHRNTTAAHLARRCGCHRHHLARAVWSSSAQIKRMVSSVCEINYAAYDSALNSTLARLGSSSRCALLPPVSGGLSTVRLSFTAAPAPEPAPAAAAAAAIAVAGLGSSDCPPPGSGDASEVALRTGSLRLHEGRAAAGRRAGGIVGAVHRVRVQLAKESCKLTRLIRLLRLA